MTDEELLIALDGWLAAKSQRLIAVDLYGEARVEREWCRSGWMRARVRYRVEQSVVLMNGYRVLLSGGG